MKQLRCLFMTLPQSDQSSSYLPYGVLAVASAVRRAGYENVELKNLDLLRDDVASVLDDIIRYRPDVIGISAPVSTGYENCRWFSREIKKRLPDSTIILGGNLAASAELILRRTDVDFCAIGEGERVCVGLLGMIGEGRPRSAFHKLRGLAFIDDGELVNTGFADDLPADKIFDIDWDFLDDASVRHYFPRIRNLVPGSISWKYFFPELASLDQLPEGMRDKTIAVIAASKGCVARCTYCHRFGKGIRIIPPELVIERIRMLMERFGTGALSFADECFGVSEKWLRRFCELIKPLGIRWKVGGMRVDTVTPDSIAMMKDAGCRSIIYGMESGSERILKVMEKKADLEGNRNAARWTIAAGLYTIPQLVLGMPGETTETVTETAEFVAFVKTLAREQDPSEVSINFSQALPGAPLYEYARMTGLIGGTLDDEERYLFSVSDKNAEDESTTLNFNPCPQLVQFSWPMLIKMTVASKYVAAFGWEHYVRKVFGSAGAPSTWALIKRRDLRSLMYRHCIPAYRLRRFFWLLALLKVLRRQNAGQALVLLWEYLAAAPVRLVRWIRPPQTEYKSLREVLKEDSHGAYHGTAEMVSLRKGR